ncbi:MAG: hypothetical protein ABIJ47_13030 [Candidatus Bathyarchaeota archaeon]
MLLLVFLCGGFALAQTDESQVDQRMGEAYMAVRAASESHGEVGYLVELLNEALAEYETGEDPDVVIARLDTVLALTAEETARSAEARNNLLVVTSAQVALVGVLVYASWRHLPRLFWSRWLRVRGGWLVEYADR